MRQPRPIFIVLGSVVALAVAVALLAVVSSGKSVGKTEVGALQPIVSVPASGRLPRDFFGIVTEDVLAAPRELPDRTLDQQASMGIGLVRQTFDWATIERKPGVYDLTALRRLVAALAAHHMRLIWPCCSIRPSSARAARRRARSRAPTPRAGCNDMATFAATAGAPLRAGRQLLARPPAGPQRADPHLAGLERAEPARLLADGPRPGRSTCACSACVGGDQAQAIPRPRS